MSRTTLHVMMVVLAAAPAAGAAAQTPPGPPTPPSRADSLFFAGNYAQARTMYEAFLAANPASLAAHVRAGYASLRLGRLDDAIAHFEPVVAGVASGRAPVALAGLAAAYALKRNTDAALVHLERADSAGYANVDALDQDEAFASLRSTPRFIALRDRVRNRAFPCLADPHAREFDFWIGEWDAYANGSVLLVGKSVIQRASGGCMILENWTGWMAPWSSPFEGKSMNFVEAGTGKWKQIWSGSAGGVATFENGEYRDGAMRFTYHNTNPQGQAVQGNFVFTNLGPNLVRQMQDASTDGGKTHQVVYDFIYVRRGSGASAVIPP